MTHAGAALSALFDCLPTGIRPGARYRRRGAAPVEHDGRTLSELDTRAVLSMAKGVRLHTSRRWTERDSAIMAELEARAFTWKEVQNLRGFSYPAWLFRPSVDAKWRHVLVLLLTAYRFGSVGLLVSYEEAVAAGCAPSRTTWWRLLRAMEQAGFVSKVDTWREHDGDRAGNRDRARNLYQPGPALFELAGGELGALEGLHEEGDGLGYDERKAERQRRAEAGARARREARVERRAKLADAWGKQRGEPVDSIDARLDADAAEPRLAHVTPEGAELFELDGDAPEPPELTPEQVEAERREARAAVREALAELEAAAEPTPEPPPLPEGPGAAMAELYRLAGAEPPPAEPSSSSGPTGAAAPPARFELDESPGDPGTAERSERAACPIPRFSLKPQTSRGGDSISERELQPANAPPRRGGPRAVPGSPGDSSSSKRAGGAAAPVGPLERSKARASVTDLAAARLLRDALRGLSPAELEAFRDALGDFERSERRRLDAGGRARFAVAWRARLASSRRPPD